MTHRIPREVYEGQAPARMPRARLVSAELLIAGELREQARAIRHWAAALRRAELSGDWASVARVREDVAACALELEEHAAKLERSP